MEHKITHMQQELKVLAQSVTQLEKDRQQKFSELSQVLLQTNEQTSKLISVTSSLNEVLSNSQTRGQWGERLAEDILRLAGFIENVNYKKQVILNGGGRPDFTFMLPQDLTLNMDVKFPILNYKKSIDAQNEEDKKRFERLFLLDIKHCFKEITERQYIHEGTVDIVLLFIPHEQIFSFIQSRSPELLEEGLKNQIVTCSPLTLFAVLAIVRKAIDHFHVEKSTKEILGHLDVFKKQWDMYCKAFSGLGKKITDLQGEYEKLASTRTNQLDLVFRKIQNQNNPVDSE